MYKNFETNPDEEFDFFLAEKLHMTVARLRRSMSADEWARWWIYYSRKAQREELARG
jgi:hypothetical protein